MQIETTLFIIDYYSLILALKNYFHFIDKKLSPKKMLVDD